MLSKRTIIIEVVNLLLECCPVKETIVVIKKRDKLHYNLPRPTTSSGWKLLRPIPSKHETLNQWAHRLQLWPNINTALVQRLVSAEYISIFELTIPVSGVAWRRAGLPSVTPCDHSAQPQEGRPYPRAYRRLRAGGRRHRSPAPRCRCPGWTQRGLSRVEGPGPQQGGREAEEDPGKAVTVSRQHPLYLSEYIALFSPGSHFLEAQLIIITNR